MGDKMTDADAPPPNQVWIRCDWSLCKCLVNPVPHILASKSREMNGMVGGVPSVRERGVKAAGDSRVAWDCVLGGRGKGKR